jgi:hypothetical protein
MQTNETAALIQCHVWSCFIHQLRPRFFGAGFGAANSEEGCGRFTFAA